VTRFSELTTMRVGGPIEHYYPFSSTRALVEGAQKIWAEHDSWMALGSGSNLVVSDLGIGYPVLHIQSRGVTVRKATGSTVQIHAEAGEDWDGFVAHTLQQGVRGLETMSGIPGTVGACVIQNIGAYGSEVSDTVVSIDFLEYPTGTRRVVSAEELALGMRTSAFKTGHLDGIVLGVTFALEPVGSDRESIELHSTQLAADLSISLGDRAPIDAVRDSVLRVRSKKGMVLSPGDPDSVSSGSFFVNPIVPERIALSLPAEMPRWLVEPEPSPIVVPLDGSVSPELPNPIVVGDVPVKLSAAWLIEYSGLSKGFSLPGSKAALSNKHALAITNRGGATAAEVAELARYIITTVGNACGIFLVPEPTLVGLEV
jgi:UDP-N-acetylmuramate dehydrogenase